MKKLLSIISILCVCGAVNAQFSVSSPNAYLQITNNLTDIDAVFLFNGISPLTEITYNGSENVEWQEYDGSFVSNTAYFSPDNATGYVLLIENVPTYWIWVIDYSAAVVNSLQIAPIEQDFCTQLTLSADIFAPELVYFDKNGQRKTLPRTFTLDYVDYAFVGEAWQDSAALKSVSSNFDQITIPAPKKDVTFTLSGDNFAEQMGLEVSSFSFDYQAVAVESHIKGTIEKRGPEEKVNENDRDKGTQNPIEGSAPLVVYLESRANTPVAVYFEWLIWNIETPSSVRRYSDENLRYTFPETGAYMVKLNVSSGGGCVYTDSIKVVTIFSFLDVPNTFSPNGDGANEEFRVAYSSLKTYKCVVFNRWGSVVFTSTDPQKGWDGNVRGKPAAEGTYYYIINAIGTDLEAREGKNKGKPKKYSLSGHINLFRGYRNN